MLIFLSQVFSQSKSGEEFACKPKDFNDLCKTSRAGAEAAKLLSCDSIFPLAKKAIRQVGGSKHEHSVTFGRDSNGRVIISPITNGDASNGRVYSDWPRAFADIHNHTNNQPPSAGDLYNLVKLNNKNPLYNTRFVVTINGTIYALYVYDLKLTNDFVTKYPFEQTRGFSPRFPEPIFDDVDKVSTYFEGRGIDRLIARERALAFVLAKNKSGAILLKQDSTGNFVTIITEEKISDGAILYVAHDCN